MNEQKIAPVLSDDEIAEIVRKWHESIGSMNTLLRATEQAVLAGVGAVRDQSAADEFALIESVLKGYPASPAQSDALRAIRALKGTPAAAVADAPPVHWAVTGAEIRALAAELVRGAEAMGDDDTDMLLEVRAPGSIKGDDGEVNLTHMLGISLSEYQDEGVYAIDPAGQEAAQNDPQSSGNPGRLAAVEPSDAMPMQPVVLAADGVVRFKRNRIVDAVYEHSYKHGYGMNEIAVGDFTADERMQFAQLVGYSIGGYGELSYVSDESYDSASAQVDAAIAASKEGASYE